jgi:two-component system sensor histidine kinase/response regulator
MMPSSSYSIRRKITELVLITCAVAVLVACGVFAVYDILSSRAALARDLTTIAQITGSNSTAALSFDDAESANEILGSLGSKPHIVEACIYKRDGSVFAKYSSSASTADFLPPPVSPEGVHSVSGFMEVFREIRLKNDVVGVIYVKSDLKELRSRMVQFAWTILGVILLSFVSVYFSAARLQRLISDPILDLARTAFAVSTGKDYSLRARKRNDDEIGFLFDRFNEMLGQIQERDIALQQARESLELRVQDRTVDLKKEIVHKTAAQEKLQHSLKELEDLKFALDQHAIVARTDERGIITFANDKFCSVSQFTREELLGQDHRIINSKYHNKEFFAGLWKAIKSGEVWKGEIKNRAKDGSFYWVDSTIVPFRDGLGKPKQFIVIRMDITGLKRIEEELRAAKDAAEGASRAKSEFLANMSHEIRTPMNGIIGMTELALDTQLTIEQREYLNMVKTSAASLLTLINDILDFSKIEAGKLDLDVADFSLRQSIGETLKALGFRAHQKGLELAWRVAPDVPDHLAGDASRVRQVLVNLVGNAVKFTEKGEVVVEIERDSQSSEAMIVLHFCVRDTGIGIAKEKQDMVFGAFTQADSSTTRKYGGTGLGLAITRRLIDLMGGKLWLESEPAVGSAFHFTIRFETASAQPAPDYPDPKILSHASILVVDDNETNRIILVEMLGRWGMQVATAKDAREALEILTRSGNREPHFSAVISDLQMPDMDGFEFVENIRKSVQFGQIPVLMLSSSAQQGEHERCRKLGISAYLAKPIQPSELLDAILSALSLHASEPNEAHNKTPDETQEVLPQSNWRQGMKVLLAEDNAVNRTLATRLLQKHGHTVVVVENGRQALEALERETVDLVLMDVQMPEMDGLEATAAIREKEKKTGGRLPIIALTAHAMKGDREKCLAAGTDDYLTKPIRTADLFAAVERLRNTKANAAPEASATTNPPGTNAFDIDAALKHVEGDRDLLDEIVRIFADQCPRTMYEIQNAIRAADLSILERAAHSLKGSASNLCATGVTQAAAEVEESARSGDSSRSREQFEALESEVEKLLRELEAFSRKVAS